MIDVNEAFQTERIAQIDYAAKAGERAAASNAERAANFDTRVAEGKLRNLGNNRFMVTDPGSWDNGEVLVLRQIDVNGVMQNQILPEHGLDMSTGQAALYTRVPMWHSLGQVIPKGVTDIDEVLSLAGLDYTVEKREYRPRNPITGEEELLLGAYTTHRMDSGKPLGTVGNVYEVVQNRQSFEFLEMLVGKRGLVWESAGALRDGARTFVCLRLPEDIVIDEGGINDRIVPFIAALNSHDSGTKFDVIVTPWRIGCGNTERFAIRDALVKWGTRHTASATSKITENIADAQTTFANSVDYFKKFAIEQNALAQTAFGDHELEGLINEIWGELDADASKQAITKRAGLTEKLELIHGQNVSELGRTAYAAERTITQYADWVKPYRPRSSTLRGNDLATRATHVLEDTSADLKNRAHRKLLVRTSR